MNAQKTVLWDWCDSIDPYVNVLVSGTSYHTTNSLQLYSHAIYLLHLSHNRNTSVSLGNTSREQISLWASSFKCPKDKIWSFSTHREQHNWSYPIYTLLHSYSTVLVVDFDLPDFFGLPICWHNFPKKKEPQGFYTPTIYPPSMGRWFGVTVHPYWQHIACSQQIYTHSSTVLLIQLLDEVGLINLGSESQDIFYPYLYWMCRVDIFYLWDLFAELIVLLGTLITNITLEKFY